MSRTHRTDWDWRALRVACPTCSAPEADWCQTMTLGRPLRRLHKKRYWAAWKRDIQASNP